MVDTVLPTAKVMEDMVVNDFLHIERRRDARSKCADTTYKFDHPVVLMSV